MDMKKFMAVFAVLVMAFAATACIVSAESDSEAVTLKGETVKLNVDEGFEYNKSNLAKLNIGKDGWVAYKENYEGYKLVLDNVEYETDDAVALEVTSNNNRVLYVECNGVNKFVSRGLDENNENTCISAAGEHVGICFIGDGEITVESSNKNATNSTAIYANYLGVKKCTLNAISSDLAFSSAAERSKHCSIAIYMVGPGMFTVSNGAKVSATSGSINSISTANKLVIVSAGLVQDDDSKPYTTLVENSELYMTSGNVTASKVDSIVNAGAAFYSGNVTINDSTVICSSGDTRVTGSADTVISEGIKLFGSFTADGSTIVAASGETYVKTLTGGAYVTGIINYASVPTSIKDSSVFTYGGKLNVDSVSEEVYNFSAGLINVASDTFTFTFTLEGSLLDVGSSDESDHPYGFVVITNSFEPVYQGTLQIEDSEFNAYGKERALVVRNIVCENPLWCEYETNGKWHKTTPADLIKQTDATSVSVGFNCYICLKASDEESAERIVKRISADTYKLPECPFEAPEGKHFKCWEVDGKQYDVGETIPVEYYAVATAVWEGSGGDNTALIAVIIIGVVLIVALGAITIFVSRR